MPLCSRCVGIYSGIIIGLLIFLILNFQFSTNTILKLFIISQIPLIIDGVTQYFKFRTSTNFLRFVTGIIGGIGSGIVIAYLILLIINHF